MQLVLSKQPITLVFGTAGGSSHRLPAVELLPSIRQSHNVCVCVTCTAGD